MRLSQGVEWGLHCCSLLAMLPPDQALPAVRLAEFHEVPPAYLAKHLQALARAGVITSEAGPRGGYRLARPAADVSVLDVVLAVDGETPAFRCEEIRKRGPAACGPEAYRRPCGISQVMASAERAWRDELRSVSIADLVDRFAQTVHPEVAQKGTAWFQEVAR